MLSLSIMENNIIDIVPKFIKEVGLISINNSEEIMNSRITVMVLS